MTKWVAQMYNEEKQHIIRCDECGYKWLHEHTVLTETHYVDNNNRHFLVLAFHCPQCNERYIVCVDNEVTLEARNKLIRIRQAIQRVMQKGDSAEPLLKALVEKKERLMARLLRHQDSLKEAYLERVEKGLLKEAK